MSQLTLFDAPAVACLLHGLTGGDPHPPCALCRAASGLSPLCQVTREPMFRGPSGGWCCTPGDPPTVHGRCWHAAGRTHP